MNKEYVALYSNDKLVIREIKKDIRHYSECTDTQKRIIDEYKSWAKTPNDPLTHQYKLNRLEYYGKLAIKNDILHLIQ